MVDYLVVGLGLAGISLCHVLEEQGKSFHVISDKSQRSSWVAGGLYNPVILKRFKPAWRAAEQLENLRPFYQSLEKKLGVTLDHPVAVWRRLASEEEQNKWFEASDRRELRPFMKTEPIPNSNPQIHAPYGYGEVLGSGRIDTKTLVESYTAYLQETGRFIDDKVVFDQIQLADSAVFYNQQQYGQVVFATGYGLHENDFFNYLPLQGTKGELLTIRSERLNETRVIKSSVFIIPLGNDLYRVGATYKWKDKTNKPTEEARDELLEKLESFLLCDYEVVDHIAGIRPTVTDRRPLVGRHPEFENMYVLNGLGSRGVMIGPYAARLLFRFIEFGEPLPPDMDITRFEKQYQPHQKSR